MNQSSVAIHRSIRRQQVFTSSGSWDPFLGVPTLVDILLVGGGGGGALNASPYGDTYSYSDPGGYGGEGGAGGQVVVIKDYLLVGPATITIGSGGSGGKHSSLGGGTPSLPVSGTETTVISSDPSCISIAALGGNSAWFDYLDNPEYTIIGNSGGNGRPYQYHVNGFSGSSSGGTPSVNWPQNGQVFGAKYGVVNYVQAAFSIQDVPISGYPYGAGGGGGYQGYYNGNTGNPAASGATSAYSGPGRYATPSNIPNYGQGKYGAGSAVCYGSTNHDAAPNSGGGGGGSSPANQNNSNFTAYNTEGGNGGSGIVVFAWND